MYCFVLVYVVLYYVMLCYVLKLELESQLKEWIVPARTRQMIFEWYYSEERTKNFTTSIER